MKYTKEIKTLNCLENFFRLALKILLNQIKLMLLEIPEITVGKNKIVYQINNAFV